jgi:sterol desaturase/sphingolipid hydroxylase (fatty acid hydroxylase superfamily)
MIWLPVVLYYLSGAITPVSAMGLTPLQLALGFVLGMVVWSFVEYTVHRFVFHFEPGHPPRWLERTTFLLHGVHHAQPWDKTRLVMPPVVTVPLGIVLYGLFDLVVGGGIGAPRWIDVLFSGFVAAYTAYDMLHYATHHWPMKWGPLARLKRYHMLHHYVTPNERFGVSSPAWDFAFRTLPPK